MASGRLGAIDMTNAATDTVAYTVPINTFSVVNVSFCNRNTTTITIRLSISASSTALATEYLEYETQLLPNGVLERTGIVMDAGKIVLCRASSTGCTVVVTGIETSTI